MTRRRPPPSSSSPFAVDVQSQVLKDTRRTKRGDGLAGRLHKSTTPLNGKGKKKNLLASIIEKIQKSKRGANDLTRRSHKSIRDQNDEGMITESMASVHKPKRKDDMTSEYCKDLESLGYPIPEIDMGDDGMVLVNTFEETFGDAYPEGVWHEFNKSSSSNIDRYVVALASFKGERRHFACTGFFIEWNGSNTILTSASLVRNSSDENKIDEDLKIEVLLPNKRRIEGMLEHYSLHYNVALIGVKDYRVVRPASVQPYWFGCSKVASVGRSFRSGELMATSGQLTSWSGTLDCKCIVRSSCKITKAGIGGPLVNMMDGKVIGMNFYDKRIGTPFLLWKYIDNILAHFAERSKLGDVGCDDCDPSKAHFWKMDGDDSVCLSRWPVPEPCWLCPNDLGKDESEDELGIELPSGHRKRYGYLGGKKVVLF